MPGDTPSPTRTGCKYPEGTNKSWRGSSAGLPVGLQEGRQHHSTPALAGGRDGDRNRLGEEEVVGGINLVRGCREKGWMQEELVAGRRTQGEGLGVGRKTGCKEKRWIQGRLDAGRRVGFRKKTWMHGGVLNAGREGGCKGKG